MNNKVNFNKIWNYVKTQLPPNDKNSNIHGYLHSKNVEKNAILIAKSNKKVDLTVARLFAAFHDIKRINDKSDPFHGNASTREVSLLYLKYDMLKNVSPKQLTLLMFAITFHSSKALSNNPTVQACWDADRLDLTRFNKLINTHLLSTKIAKKIAENYNKETINKNTTLYNKLLTNMLKKKFPNTTTLTTLFYQS